MVQHMFSNPHVSFISSDICPPFSDKIKSMTQFAPRNFFFLYVYGGEPHVLCSETLARQPFDTNGAGRTPMINNICGREKSQTSIQTNNTTRQHIQPTRPVQSPSSRIQETHTSTYCIVHFLFFIQCGWCCKGKVRWCRVKK